MTLICQIVEKLMYPESIGSQSLSFLAIRTGTAGRHWSGTS